MKRLTVCNHNQVFGFIRNSLTKRARALVSAHNTVIAKSISSCLELCVCVCVTYLCLCIVSCIVPDPQLQTAAMDCAIHG